MTVLILAISDLTRGIPCQMIPYLVCCDLVVCFA